jgi:hypothetical protein
MTNVRQDFREISVARDKIVFALTERTGNIWLSKSEHATIELKRLFKTPATD